MPAEHPAKRSHRLWIAAGWLSVWFVTSLPLPAAESFTTGGVFIGQPSGWTPEQTPVDFLDVVGAHAKVRWRQLYRAPAPTPSTDRLRAAFTLGALVGEGFLVLQAAGMQQFRNTTQDILGYCRVLGVGEKASPRLMAMSKLAAMGRWASLRQEAVDGHQELSRLLREQRDEDLAVLLDLGVWLRVLEISSTLVVAEPEPDVRQMCIGSVELLKDLRQRLSQLSKPAQQHETTVAVRDMLDTLIRTWTNTANNPPGEGLVVKTNDRLKILMRKHTHK